jgi:hypothetical protein
MPTPAQFLRLKAITRIDETALDGLDEGTPMIGLDSGSGPFVLKQAIFAFEMSHQVFGKPVRSWRLLCPYTRADVARRDILASDLDILAHFSDFYGVYPYRDGSAWVARIPYLGLTATGGYAEESVSMLRLQVVEMLQSHPVGCAASAIG